MNQEPDPTEYTPRRNRTYIGDGLYEVLQVLRPFVAQRMAEAHGNNWRRYAIEVLNRNRRELVGDDFEQDPSHLLNLMRHEFAPFSAVLKSGGRTLISKLINVRNQWAHEYEIDVSDTFQAFDSFCKLFALLNHSSPDITARKNTLQRILAQGVQPQPTLQEKTEPTATHACHDEPRTSDRDRARSGSLLLESPNATVVEGKHQHELGGGHRAAQKPSTPTGTIAIGLSVLTLIGAVILTRFPIGSPDGISTVASGEPRLDPSATVPAPTSGHRGRTTQKTARSTVLPTGESTLPNGPLGRGTKDTASEIDSSASSTPSSAVSYSGTISTVVSQGSQERSPTERAPTSNEPLNLVINGDFGKAWDIGWHKDVTDPTEGSFVVERQNGMLHISLDGQNTGQVWQVVSIRQERGLEGLGFEAGIKLVPKRAGMLGLAPPVETAFVVQFRNREDRDLGQIWYTQFATTGLEGSGLAGVPETLHATGQRCQVSLREGFNRIVESLDRKTKDCLARPVSEVSSLMLVVLMRTANPQSAAEAFLDRVRLYYH